MDKSPQSTLKDCYASQRLPHLTLCPDGDPFAFKRIPPLRGLIGISEDGQDSRGPQPFFPPGSREGEDPGRASEG